MTKTINTLSEKNYQNQNESLFGAIGVLLSKLSLLSEFLDAKEDQAISDNGTSTLSTECLSGMRLTIDSVIEEIFSLADRADCDKNEILRELDQLTKVEIFIEG